MSEKKRGPGQPRAEIDLEKLEHLSRLRLNDQDIATLLGISRQTLHTHKKSRPEVAAAIERGIASSKMKLTANLMQASDNGDVKAMIFLAKNWLGYSDRQDIHTTGSTTTVTVTAADLTDDQLAEIIKGDK